jgi:hypothetical protein
MTLPARAGQGRNRPHESRREFVGRYRLRAEIRAAKPAGAPLLHRSIPYVAVRQFGRTVKKQRLIDDFCES